jgi:hypothetical protein
MVNEPILKEAVLSLFDQCESLHVTVFNLLDEVAALRETVRGLDPTFDDVLAQKRAAEKSDDSARKAKALLAQSRSVVAGSLLG